MNNYMNPKYLLLSILAFILLVFASCSKSINNRENTKREQPTQPEGITIDTTWDEEINVPF